MTIHIVSGYFNAFHDGHKQYLSSALKDCDELIVLLQNDEMQRKKYGLNARSVYEIMDDINKWWYSQQKGGHLEILVNDNRTVASLLNEIAKTCKKEEITFMKDGDRDFDSLPEDEKQVLLNNNINFKFLGNPKIASSTEILNGSRV